MKKLLLSDIVAFGFFGAATFSPAVWACCGPVTQPTIDQINADPTFLWPPNHKMVEVQLEVLGNEYLFDWEIIGVTIINQGPGEGDPLNDPDYIFGGQLLQLRAERSGAAGMRTYAVEVRARNQENTLFATATKFVTVPHDMGDD